MLRRLCALLSSLFVLCGCSQPQPESPPGNPPGSFALNELNSATSEEGTLKTWRATAHSDDASFTFQLEMLLKELRGDIPMAFSKGAIIRDTGMDGSKYLKDVARAIEVTEPATTTAEHVDRLEFSTAILGTSLSRESGSDVIGGAFTSNSPGDWIAFKLFLGDGEGEVYLNINPVLGIGEFSVKDPEYSSIVIEELAKVWLPR